MKNILFAFLMLAPIVSFGQVKGFAVVELFTSEGCSSCPPADKLAAATLTEYAGRDVYILAFHVDYWNRLGWKDIYSSHDWSARQENYEGKLGLDGAYTPQVIVNGKTQFTGSDSRALHAAINIGLASNAPNAILLKSSHTASSSIDIAYTLTGSVNGKQLLVALVQKNAISNVKSGENAGHLLKHVNVVRGLQTVALGTKTAGHLTLDIPVGLSMQDCTTIAFLQGADGGITAASATE
jgi:hypothetical protein